MKTNPHKVQFMLLARKTSCSEKYEPKSYYLINNTIKIMMSKSKRTIIQTVFLIVFITTGVFNVSCGQAKVDKLDKLISAYTEYGKFNGSVLVAEKGKVIYKKGFGLADME